jgi:hypothetical protein
MKPLLVIMVFLIIATQAWSCAYRYEVTSQNIDNLPVIGFIESRDGNVTYRLHFRDTANLEGLGSVYLTIKDGDTELFSGQLFIFDNKERDLHTVDFTIRAGKITDSTLTICAYNSTEGEFVHSCVFTYVLPLELIHSHFKANTFSPIVVKSDRTPAVDEFKAKKFETSRGK